MYTIRDSFTSMAIMVFLGVFVILALAIGYDKGWADAIDSLGMSLGVLFVTIFIIFIFVGVFVSILRR